MKKKLTMEESLRLILEDKIEEILFNEKDLNTLKDLTNKVSIGTTPAKTLREFIVDFRKGVIEKLIGKLVRIFKFYAHQMSTQEQLSKFTSGDDSQMKTDLQEKNQLLAKVATRIDNISRKVKQKLEL